MPTEAGSQAPGRALAGDQRAEVAECCLRGDCSGRLADVIGCARWVQVVGAVGEPTEINANRFARLLGGRMSLDEAG